MSALTALLTQLNQHFDTAFNQRQARHIGELYADNAVVMPAPAGAPVHGRAAITQFFQGLIDMGITAHQLRMTAIVASDTMATQYGAWSAQLTDAEGVTQTVGGNVQLVFMKQADQRWLAVSHIWN